MADPIGNYLAGLGFMGGPEVNPGALTPEQLAQLGLSKFLPTPGLSLEVGPQMERTMEGLENMSNLGQYGIPQTQNSAGIPYDPAPVAKAVGDMAMRGYLNAPKSSVGSFGGRLAEGWSQGAADKYRQMISEGYVPQAATKETGIFRTADNRLKFEIPDTASSLTNKATNELMRYGPNTTISGNLSDFLIHPQLYENYPGMKYLPTSISLVPPKPGGQMNYLGVYRPGSQSLAANSSYIEGPEGIHSILLHEAGGHHIQQVENFAKGSSPQVERQIGDNFLNRVTSEIENEAYRPYPDMNKLDRLSALKQEFSRNFNPFDAYQRSAGEADARGIQARMMMTPSGLRAISPADTVAGLVPFNRQIVRFD